MHSNDNYSEARSLTHAEMDSLEALMPALAGDCMLWIDWANGYDTFGRISSNAWGGAEAFTVSRHGAGIRVTDLRSSLGPWKKDPAHYDVDDIAVARELLRFLMGQKVA